MKNTMKKMLSLLLVAVMISGIGILPSATIPAQAATVSIPSDAVEYNGHYYKVYEIEKTWKDAKEFCKKLGGYLVTITSPEENDFIVKQIKDLSLNGYNIGFTDEDVEGDWKWITEEEKSFVNWGQGQPDNCSKAGYVQNCCVIMAKNSYELNSCARGEWDDSTEFNLAGIICEWEPNEQTVTGIKDGISTSHTVSIDGVWYVYDTSVPGLADAISNIQLGATITCKIRFGKIVSCIASKSAPRVTVSIKTDTTSIAYDCKEDKYSIDKIDDLQVVITNELKSNTKNVAGYDVTFDKIVISTTNTAGVLYFKDGLIDKEREFAMTLDSPVTLKPGDTRTFKIEEPVFVNKEYVWGETETQKEIEIGATCYKGAKDLSSDSQKITVENKGAEKNIEQKKELDDGMRQAAGLLEKTTGVLHDDYLEKLLGKDCLQEVTNVLKCKVALSSAVLKAKQNATLEEKLIDKLMKKANISKNWLGTVYTTNITHSVAGETKENGRFTVEFNIELSNISLGSGNNPFVSFSFDTTYEIKGGKKFETREGTVLSYFSYANIQTFADSVESVALEQIEYAYNLGYGNDLNKVCEMFFDDTITKILSKTKAESYSHVFYQSMVYPSKQAAIHCPVDVFVYDTQGNLCASIESNEITLDCEDMDIVVVGDEKYLTLYGEYEIEIVAFANDTMNITITEYASADDVLRTVAFNDLALLPGDSFVATVSEDYFFDEYQINKNEEEIITADSDESTIHSTQAVEIVDKQATCIEDGAYHVICEKCNMTVLSAVIPATGHADENQDGSCDACGEVLEQPETPTDPEEPTDPEVPTEPDVPTDPTTPDEPDADCSCMCHSKNSFMQFFYKIFRLFWQLFGMNMDCDCGAKHFDSYFFG